MIPSFSIRPKAEISMPISNPARSAGLILQHRFTDIDQSSETLHRTAPRC
ncbi:MAG TPA: hypothetical protein IGR64_13840 [Leptolyngbyaceae cyanobacterium M65_K2018_010]|nr:hypothetical protein [Leptolyngbyaceae cyanobacterium M65_K2018_010]